MSAHELPYALMVDMSSPEAVFSEVSLLSGLVGESIDINRLAPVFDSVCDLYRGNYHGYRACNTLYHDLRHTTDVFLCLARLLHGAYEEGIRFSSSDATLALISTLLHDTGYIQESGDRTGTGGKYTLTHVERSVDFMNRYLPRHGFSREETTLCANFVLGTSINADVCSARFPAPSSLLLGKMIGTADLIGQMSDRIYLEKLLFLYREFREANIPAYGSELELLASTIGFYELMDRRLNTDLSGVRCHMRSHFRVRWRIDRDLYQEAIDRNLSYLDMLMKEHHKDYRSNLKREGLVRKLFALESAERLLDEP